MTKVIREYEVRIDDPIPLMDFLDGIDIENGHQPGGGGIVPGNDIPLYNQLLVGFTYLADIGSAHKALYLSHAYERDVLAWTELDDAEFNNIVYGPVYADVEETGVEFR